MKKIVITGLLLSFYMISANAMVVQSQTAMVVNEYQGKLYQMQRSDWHNITDENALISHEIKTADWSKIISTGETELARALLLALSDYLPKEDLKPFLRLALLRPADEGMLKRQDMAYIAYTIWQQQYSADSSTQIRKHPVYRQKLIPDVLWKNLFDVKNNRFKTTDEAIDFLRANRLLAAQSYDHFDAQAINKISRHPVTEDLKLWMDDENFNIALGSWLALSRKIPEQVASDILQQALWWQEELTYSYGSGCIRETGQLTPLLAAFDLFSDYLSTDEIHQALIDVPELWLSEQPRFMTVKNNQMYQAIKRLNTAEDSHLADNIPAYLSFHSKHIYQGLTGQHLEDFFNQSSDLYHLGYIPFNQPTLDFLLKKINQPEDGFRHDRFIDSAFHSKNSFAQQYIAAVIESEWQYRDLGVVKYADTLLIDHQPIWPQNWSALKQKAIDKYMTINPVEEFSGLSIRLNQ